MATGPLNVTTSEAPFYMRSRQGQQRGPTLIHKPAGLLLLAPLPEGTLSTLETYLPT